MNDALASAGVVYLGVLLLFFLVAVALEQRHRPARAARPMMRAPAAPGDRLRAARR